MLEEFSNENLKAEQQSRFVIFIDELDKLSSRDELIEAINGLKDLFHISGVHFVVSVSTDALASFEQRGLAARDAFDSAFDTIVKVKRLTVQESLDVISRRVTGFPTVLSVFCHAWSGGLPRDLLRTARRCVEVQRNSKHALATTAIMKAVVISELIGQVDAKLRIWNETGSGGTQALLAVRKTLNDFEKGSETPTSVIAGLSQSSIQKDAVDRVSGQVQIGMALLECLSDISQAQFHGELPEGTILANVSALARAVSMEGEPRELRNEAVGEVIREVVVLA